MIPSGPLAHVRPGRRSMTEREALAALRDSDPTRVAQGEAALWAMWCHAGVPEVDKLFGEGVAAMERQDLDEAEGVFARITARARFRRRLEQAGHGPLSPR